MLKIVKVLPFIYVGLFILAVAVYYLFGVVTIVDKFCYISPFPIFVNLLQSHVCGYCNWHKAVCLLMFVTPIGIVLTNCFESVLIYDYLTLIVVVMLVITIIAGYIVFRRKPNCY